MLQVLGQNANHSLGLQHYHWKEAGNERASKTRALDMFPGGSCKYYQQKSTHPINQRGFAKHHGHFPLTILDCASCDTPMNHCPQGLPGGMSWLLVTLHSTSCLFALSGLPPILPRCHGVCGDNRGSSRLLLPAGKRQFSGGREAGSGEKKGWVKGVAERAWSFGEPCSPMPRVGPAITLYTFGYAHHLLACQAQRRSMPDVLA